jgi:hypothetical protein
MRPNATSFLILDWESVAANTSKTQNPGNGGCKTSAGLPFNVGATHVGAISDPTIAATAAQTRFMSEGAGG